MSLTVKGIARLSKKGRYADGGRYNLYLQISKTGVKSWLFRYMREVRSPSVTSITAGKLL